MALLACIPRMMCAAAMAAHATEAIVMRLLTRSRRWPTAGERRMARTELRLESQTAFFQSTCHLSRMNLT